MKKNTSSRSPLAAALAAMLGLGLAAASSPAFGEQGAGTSESAGAIVERMDAAMAFDECELRLSFTDAKASGQSRTIEAQAWYAKSSGTMMAFSAPAREKGKRILMIGDSMWMSVPAISKPVRLSGKDSFMGTSFTNDDVMNFDKADDYDSRMLSSDAESWLIELSAKRRSVPYQKVILRVGRDYLPLEQSMYLLSGELSKTILYSDPRDYGGKKRPSTIRAEDAMSKGSSTTVRFESIVEKRVDRSRLSPDGFMR
jgi:hypothetical protein